MHDRWLGSGHREFGKGKNMLIKHNMPRDVGTISGNMKTFVSFMKRAITKKNTLLGTKLELTLIIWTEMGPSSTPKHLEKGVVRLFIKENFNGRLHIQNTSRSTVDERACSDERITPKPKRNRCMVQKSKTSSNNVTMLTFY